MTHSVIMFYYQLQHILHLSHSLSLSLSLILSPSFHPEKLITL